MSSISRKFKFIHSSSLLAILSIVLLGCNAAPESKVPAIPEQEIKAPAIPDPALKLALQTPFPENSIGVAYLDTIEGNHYQMTILLPNSLLHDSILEFRYTGSGDIPLDLPMETPLDLPPQTIVLFDEAGALITLKNVRNCVSRLWCENDGGMRFQLTYVVSIAKRDFIRTPRLKNKKKIGDMACFAVVNYNPKSLKPLVPKNTANNEEVAAWGSNGEVVAWGKIVPGTGAFHARIRVWEDDAEEGNYCIFLDAFNTENFLDVGCCGP